MVKKTLESFLEPIFGGDGARDFESSIETFRDPLTTHALLIEGVEVRPLD